MGPNQQNPYPGNVLRPNMPAPGGASANQPPTNAVASSPANLFNPAYAPAPSGATPPLASFAPAASAAMSPAFGSASGSPIAPSSTANPGAALAGLPSLASFGGTPALQPPPAGANLQPGLITPTNQPALISPTIIGAIGAPPSPAPFGPPATVAPFASPSQSPFGLPAPSPLAPSSMPSPLPGVPLAPSSVFGAGLPAGAAAVAPMPQPSDPFNGLRNPYESQPKRFQLPGKKLALVAGGSTAALLLLVILIASAAGGSNSKQPASSNTAVSSSLTGNLLPDILSRPDGTLDVNNLINTSRAIKPQSIQAKANEQVNLSSGFSFLARSIGTYQSTNPQPRAHYKFVLVHVVIGNRSRNDNLSVSYLDFKLRDGENQLLDAHPQTQQITGNTLAKPTEIKPGKQIDGRLVFEVDALQREWALVHRETYQKTTDNTTFTVEGRILLDAKSEARSAQ